MASAADAGPNDDNVDRIRDILFGGQMKDYERRFLELEKRFAAEMERARKGFDDRVQNLETFLTQEIERLTEKSQAERKERLEALSDIGHKLASVEQALLDQLETAQNQNAQDRLELRKEFLDQSRQLGVELRETIDGLRTETLEESRRLQGEKTGRDELSRLMTEVALRLSGDFHLPES